MLCPRLFVRLYRKADSCRPLNQDSSVTASAIPNDRLLSQLVGLWNTGQTGGLAGADIDAPGLGRYDRLLKRRGRGD